MKNKFIFILMGSMVILACKPRQSYPKTQDEIKTTTYTEISPNTYAESDMPKDTVVGFTLDAFEWQKMHVEGETYPDIQLTLKLHNHSQQTYQGYGFSYTIEDKATETVLGKLQVVDAHAVITPDEYFEKVIIFKHGAFTDKEGGYDTLASYPMDQLGVTLVTGVALNEQEVALQDFSYD
jgi:hypothetical protein